MLLSEYRNGEVCYCKNTEMEGYATAITQKWRNMPCTVRIQKRGIFHNQNTEME
jgi:hypothetical protein